jgi:hypothetical protein
MKPLGLDRRLVEVEGRVELENDLASALMNKGNCAFGIWVAIVKPLIAMMKPSRLEGAWLRLRRRTGGVGK